MDGYLPSHLLFIIIIYMDLYTKVLFILIYYIYLGYFLNNIIVCLCIFVFVLFFCLSFNECSYGIGIPCIHFLIQYYTSNSCKVPEF